MKGYHCSSCGRNAKLPDFCCGKSMTQRKPNVNNNPETQASELNS